MMIIFIFNTRDVLVHALLPNLKPVIDGFAHFNDNYFDIDLKLLNMCPFDVQSLKKFIFSSPYYHFFLVTLNNNYIYI